MRISVTAGAAGSVSVQPRVPRTWSGSGAPPGGLGFVGDQYERTNGDYYRKTAAGWGAALFNRTGPTGSSSGDVVGPASSVNNRVAVYNGTTGKLLKDGGKTLPTGTIVGTSDSQTLSNKSIGADATADMHPVTLRQLRLTAPYNLAKFGTVDTTGAVPADTTIAAAIASGEKIILPPGIISTEAGIAFPDNMDVVGSGPIGAKRTLIRGVSGVPVGTPLVTIGRGALLSGVGLEYASGLVTGTEVRGERVLLSAAGVTYNLQRPAVVDRIVFGRCGTAISDFGDAAFSVSFRALEIGAHSYAGVDMYSSFRTGNIWENVYINGGDVYTPVYGFNLEGYETGGWAGQLNIEHQTYSGAAFRGQDLSGWNCVTLHIEGVDCTSSNGQYVLLDRSDVEIGTLGVLNTRSSSGSNQAVVRLKDGGHDASMAFKRSRSALRVGLYVPWGIADPSASLYPSYSSGRRGALTVSGLQHFARVSGATGGYEVYIDDIDARAYSGDTVSVDWYKYARERYIGSGVDVMRFGSHQRGNNRPNLLRNADFSIRGAVL